MGIESKRNEEEKHMNARGKLNVAYFNGSLVLAGILGLFTESWIAFFLAAAVLLMIQLAVGGIRLKKEERPVLPGVARADPV
jgi:hypothetical protein